MIVRRILLQLLPLWCGMTLVFIGIMLIRGAGRLAWQISGGSWLLATGVGMVIVWLGAVKEHR